uniref:AAA-ATPase-like domain-containing protein n=1 Tax=Mycena chlorophos TaxID=658473 RepID=A0ABQ0L628_MYCCL|nr:predicted protein [Mycena chlorophos]
MAALLTLATNDLESNGGDDYYVPGSPQSPTSDSDSTPDFLLHVRGAVFARGGRVLRPPREDEDFDDIVNRIGVPLVFKRHALEQFARLVGCGFPLLLRRPEGWGLDLFVSMLSAAFDEDYDDANDPFVPLLLDQPSAILSERGLHKFFILELDFKQIAHGSDLATTLSHFLLARCRTMLKRYDFVGCGPPTDSASEAIVLLALFLKNMYHIPSLFLVVKNFDSLIYNFNDGPAVLNAFVSRIEFECYAQSFAGVLFTSSIDNGTIFSPLDHLGNPKPLRSRLHSLVELRSTMDLTRHPAFQTAVGFTEQEVNDLDDAFKHLASNRTSLIDMVKAARRSCRSCVFADPAWVDRRLPPIDPSGFADAKVQPVPELDCSEGGEGVFPATLVWTVVETKYGFPRRDTLSS